MPKIDVNEKLFFQVLGKKMGTDELTELLTAAKAELDDWPEGEGILRVELNDTNRPDLWSTLGLARQLSIYLGNKAPAYRFFSRPGTVQKTEDRRVVVDAGLAGIRPYIASFVAEGKKITDALLREIIQSQEKLCGNFGRKRRTIAMGVSRADLIQWPVHYGAADPDATLFIPLDFDKPLSMRKILSDHPKGREYGPLVAAFEKFPLLSDGRGEVLTFPPVINSALIGGVRVGDSRLFIDLTGPELDTILLACSIAACDFADMGFTILPVAVHYPVETRYGRTIATPFYFQKETVLAVKEAEKRLGEKFTPAQAARCIKRLGSAVRVDGELLVVSPPEYRNDFLHPVDVIEEIMIGRGMESFEPVMPRDFTVGRISEAEWYARSVRETMIGLGYQEMIYGYLGSRTDFVDRMGIDGAEVMEIENPMTESFDIVRNSILPNLLASESVSANAAYPHRIFEVGKIVVRDPSENSGSRTHNTLAFLVADRETGFNEVDAHLLALFYYLSLDPRLVPLSDPRFIPGRAAEIRVKGRKVGIMGEIHPAVLENWGIQMPCAGVELSLDLMREE
ncbi:MAG TPA: phenylalanine--tRNA ligase subunit beta [Spirochaetia bacterium]|nr:phenylalanine--tRNA ligase subunit beta [Spirochaetia bacterium]